MRVALIIIAITVIGVGFYVSLWLFPFWWFPALFSCDENITSKISNDSYLVEEKVINCGATSDYATQYTIKNIRTKVTDTALSLKGDLTDICDIRWDAENIFTINCHYIYGDVYIYQQKDKFEDVTIRYYHNGFLKFKEEPIPTRVAYECKDSKYLTVSYDLDNVNVQAYEGSSLVLEEDLSENGEKYTNGDNSIIFWSEGDAQMSTFLQVNNQDTFDCKFQTIIHNGELRE